MSFWFSRENIKSSWIRLVMVIKSDKMLKTINEVAKQNFRMLLLTEPGERVWDANYGIGLKRFLFEQRFIVESELVNKIIIYYKSDKK